MKRYHLKADNSRNNGSNHNTRQNQVQDNISKLDNTVYQQNSTKKNKGINQNNKNNKEENLIKKPKEITFNEGRNKMASTDKIW